MKVEVVAAIGPLKIHTLEQGFVELQEGDTVEIDQDYRGAFVRVRGLDLTREVVRTVKQLAEIRANMIEQALDTLACAGVDPATITSTCGPNAFDEGIRVDGVEVWRSWVVMESSRRAPRDAVRIYGRWTADGMKYMPSITARTEIP